MCSVLFSPLEKVQFHRSVTERAVSWRHCRTNQRRFRQWKLHRVLRRLPAQSHSPSWASGSSYFCPLFGELGGGAALERRSCSPMMVTCPDVPDPLVSHRCVDNRVRDRAMAHEGLKRTRIDPASSQGVPGSVAQHVSVDREAQQPRQAGQSASAHRRRTGAPSARIGTRSQREDAHAVAPAAAAARHPASRGCQACRSWRGGCGRWRYRGQFARHLSSAGRQKRAKLYSTHAR